MAQRAYRIEEVYLLDWFEKDGVTERPIRIYPLTIKKLKLAGEILDQLKGEDKEEGKEEKVFIDVLLETVAFAMQTYEPALADVDVLADHIEMDTINLILEIAMGIKLNDPNLQAAMAAATN